MAYVEVESREGVQRYQLDREQVSVGRLAFNDIVLNSPQISRQHAQLRRIDNVWWIADLHSTNGLHIGSARVQHHQLASGDVVALAPGISVRFVDGEVGSAPVTSLPDYSAQQPAWGSGAYPVARAPEPPEPPEPRMPRMPPMPPLAASYPAQAPRSPFADDEEHFVPPGMARPGRPTVARQPGYGDASQMPPGMDAWDMPGMGGMPDWPYAPPAPDGRGAAAFPGFPGQMPGDGDAAYARRGQQPPDPFGTSAPHPMPGYPGQESYGGAGYPGAGYGMPDPFRRSSPSGSQSRPTAGPAYGLLHVCQTCGQRTAPDAVYCQNCHHSIAYECGRCGLTLLPIQDRCPRCQSPNPASVQRNQRGYGALS